MKTLILNGSPHAKSGNTEIFIRNFAKGLESPYEVRYVLQEDAEQLAEYLLQFDTVIIAMPLYIHAMPGIVMRLIEHMKAASGEGKAIGFIVQSGFVESSQSQYLERYLRTMAKRLNYIYLGTVIRGNSAGISMMPEKMNQKLFKSLIDLGKYFDETRTFNKDIVDKFAKPYRLSKVQSGFMTFLYKVGIGNFIWNQMLKSNDALEKRFDKPFI